MLQSPTTNVGQTRCALSHSSRLLDAFSTLRHALVLTVHTLLLNYLVSQKSGLTAWKAAIRVCNISRRRKSMDLSTRTAYVTYTSWHTRMPTGVVPSTTVALCWGSR
ncbi:hypothetical protein Plhal304r1_c011g0042471 [Plasmopara halstedii]